MITRREAEQQAEDCFVYHLGAYVLTMAALTLFGGRSSRWIGGAWGTGVLLHGLALYASSPAREMLLRTTAEVMENRRTAHDQHLWTVGQASA
jgi:hypothetical protein